MALLLYNQVATGLANSTKKECKKHIKLYVKFIVICKNLKDNKMDYQQETK